jgi:predicted transcriptional regulator
MEEKIMPTLEPEKIANFADMLAALGAEPRLRIVRLLLQAHPEGLVVGEIGAELGIPPSTCCGAKAAPAGANAITSNLYARGETRAPCRKPPCWPRSAAAIRPRSRS